jgi:choline kinase
MVDVAGRPILGWVWRALEAVGVDELVVIRGYRGRVLERFVRDLVPKVTFIDNTEWETNNVLLSLACARQFLDQPTYVSYSDIVFTSEVAERCARCVAEIGLVTDREFRRIYDGRTEHPLDEAEVMDCDDHDAIARVGKRALPAADAHGEFIGLVRLGATGVTAVAGELDRLAARFAGRDGEPFQRAARYRNAYLTDLLQELIAGGTRIDPIWIDGGWREIDTGQDLDRARELLQSWP